MQAVHFHPEARLELRSAAEFYESHAPNLGREFVHEVRVATERIAELPESGSPDPDETGIRRAVLARFPFILVYQRVGDAVEVIAVMHQRQKPGYWGNRK